MFETFLVQSGKGEITVENQVTNVKAGDCVVVSPGEMYEVKNTGGAVMEILVIGEEINQ